MFRRVWIAANVAVAAVLAAPSAAAADQGVPPAPTPTDDLNRIIGNLRLWLFGLLGVAATLMLTVAGLLYVTAGGSPTQIERAKTAFKSAMVGYAMAALAPVLVGVLRSLTA